MSTLKSKMFEKFAKNLKESKLMNELLNYKVEPNEKLKRKIDYYITPYNNRIQCGRGMTFSDDEGEKNFEDGEVEDRKKHLAAIGWNKMRNMIQSLDMITLKNLRRHLLLIEPGEDYMTKLDLIDTHPDLFTQEDGYWLVERPERGKQGVRQIEFTKD